MRTSALVVAVALVAILGAFAAPSAKAGTDCHAYPELPLFNGTHTVHAVVQISCTSGTATVYNCLQASTRGDLGPWTTVGCGYTTGTNGTYVGAAGPGDDYVTYRTEVVFQGVTSYGPAEEAWPIDIGD